jgi:UDP-N-acetylglucosamine diphosphorylase / glucose-1-phosphate thymidylyltransferase / UDP-N-acetylgalactosamine diphosphorylase / glucosamine-1-phosphate N-acetyltransferase / galactosamine-1-phosphate N-acetyltransferase
MIDRAVVLARGLGTRLKQEDDSARLSDAQRRAAAAGLKAMMPINGHPFLDYVLSALADASISRVALVVAPDHDALEQRYRSEAPPERLTIDFVVQEEARGTADAVLAAEQWTHGAPFLAMNADNLYPARVLMDLAALEEPGLPAFDADDLVQTSNIPADRIKAFATVEVDEDGFLRSIVEKPEDLPPKGGSHNSGSLPPKGGSHNTQSKGGSHKHTTVVASGFSRKIYVSMNIWRFDARIFDACRDVPRSARGEFELPEAVALATRRGVRFRAIAARGPVLDLSRRADAAELEARLRDSPPKP